MDLRHLTDKQLLNDTDALVKTERELTTKILHHLREIERRRLYCGLGYSSLFDYCLKALGYSEGTAHRRIQAARLLSELPEIEERIEAGNLSLINISQVSAFINQQEITSPDEKRALLSEVENLSKKECEKKLFALSGKQLPAQEEKKRINSKEHKVVMILTDDTMKKLDSVKALLGKRLSNEQLLNVMSDLSIELLRKKKFKLTIKTKDLPPPVAVKGRYVPAYIKETRSAPIAGGVSILTLITGFPWHWEVKAPWKMCVCCALAAINGHADKRDYNSMIRPLRTS